MCFRSTLHSTSALVGLAVIASGPDWLARLAGLLPIATATPLLQTLVRVMRSYAEVPSSV